jgi:hypothetical protein
MWMKADHVQHRGVRTAKACTLWEYSKGSNEEEMTQRIPFNDYGETADIKRSDLLAEIYLSSCYA